MKPLFTPAGYLSLKFYHPKKGRSSFQHKKRCLKPTSFFVMKNTDNSISDKRYQFDGEIRLSHILIQRKHRPINPFIRQAW